MARRCFPLRKQVGNYSNIVLPKKMKWKYVDLKRIFFIPGENVGEVGFFGKISR